MEARPVRILAATLGSSGDVDPIVGLGRVLLTYAPFEAMVRLHSTWRGTPTRWPSTWWAAK